MKFTDLKPVKPKPRHSGWTLEERMLLKKLIDMHLIYPEMAKFIGHTVGKIRNEIQRAGFKKSTYDPVAAQAWVDNMISNNKVPLSPINFNKLYAQVQKLQTIIDNLKG